MQGLYFESGIDKGFENDLARMKMKLNNFTAGVGEEGRKINSTFENIAKTVGGIYIADKAIQLATSVVRVRGEVQQLDVAFTTMLGSQEKSNELMQQAIDLAAKTPFELSDVSTGAKQLLSYNFAADEVIGSLNMLGDIASGVSAPLNDIVYLYGTLRSQGRAYAIDIRQFAQRGIPIYEELGKVLGVSVEKVNELVSDGKVGFSEVEQVFKNLTAEGGKFSNLMEKQSQTITGRISNIQDSIYQMMNKIGESNEGLINDVLGGISWMVENYEQIGNVLINLVEVYGAYRAALILVSAAQKYNAQVLAEVKRQTASAAKEQIVLSEAEALAAARGVVFQRSMKGMVTSVKSLTAAIASNPIGLIASAIALAIPFMQDWGDAIVEVDEDIQNSIDSLLKYNKTQQDSQKNIVDLSKKYEDLAEKTNKTAKDQDELQKIEAELQKNRPYLISSSDTFAEKLDKIKTAGSEAAKEIDKLTQSERNLLIVQATKEKQAAEQTIQNLNEQAAEMRRRSFIQYTPGVDTAPIKQLQTYDDLLKNYQSSHLYSKRLVGELIVSEEGRTKILQDISTLDILINKKKQEALLYKESRFYQEEEYDRMQDQIETLQDISDIYSSNIKMIEDYESATMRLGAAQKTLSSVRKKDAKEPFKPKEIEETEKEKLNNLDAAYQKRRNEIEKQAREEKWIIEKKNNELLLAEKEYIEKYIQISTDGVKNAQKEGRILEIDSEFTFFKAKNEEYNKWFHEILDVNKTYKQKQLEINQKYDREIAAFNSKGLKDQAQESEKNRKIELKNLDEFILSRSEAYQKWNSKTLPKLVDEGIKILKQQQQQISELIKSETNPEQLVIYNKMLSDIDAKIKEITEKRKEDNETFKDQLELFNEISELASNFADSIGEGNSQLAIMLSGLASSAAGFVELAQGIKLVEKATTSLEKASAILAIISAAFKIINAVSDAIAKADNQRTLAAIKELEVRAAINKQLAERNELEQGYYGSSSLQSAISGLKTYNTYLDLQKESLRDIRNLQPTASSRDLLGLNPVASIITGSLSAKDKKNITKAVNEADTELEKALASITVTTKDRSDFWNKVGFKDRYKSLLDLYPELIDANGKLNISIAQVALETENLDGAQQVALESFIKYDELAEESYQQFGDYISDIFGGVTDAVLDSFQAMHEGGEDAMTSLESSFSDMIEIFSQDAIQLAIVQPLIDQLDLATTEIGKSYAAGDLTADELQQNILNELSSFYTGISKLEDPILQAYENADALAESLGFASAFNSDSSTQTKSGAISSAITENTASELLGRTNEIMLSNERIDNRLIEMLEYSMQNLVYLNNISINSNSLPEIAKNTQKMLDALRG